ncbi:MAG TPA: hypothetical protein VGQ81_11285 [Acidobacteriota bacterium]|jgi:hypothetical protein|nr:hypothetical protein [Acidobacteriota bacterium]
METHVKVLGVLNIILGGMGVMGALIILIIFGGTAGIVGASAHSDPDARFVVPLLSAIGGGLFFLILALSVPGIIAGIGLLKFRPWARILTIILSVLNLLHIPFGTAVGIYGLWVLLSRETEPLFTERPVEAQVGQPPVKL